MANMTRVPSARPTAHGAAPGGPRANTEDSTATHTGDGLSAEYGVQLDHVRIDYTLGRQGKRLTAVEDASFGIRPGEMVCVVGPSGCGKSTILTAVAGLIPHSSGTLTVHGKAVRGPGNESAVVFQRPALLPWKSAVGNVIYGLRLRGVRKDEARRRAEDAVELVGLTAFKDMYPYQMSGGMQQRINLARALASDAEVLLLDEPFAALDAQQREILQKELLRIWESTKKTGLFITHQIDEAVLLGDRVVIMSKGPGSRIIKETAIDFPHPRQWDIRQTPEFGAYTEEIWLHLKDQQESA
jgi:NitT/TauT family transport system ATP-binding protein